MCLLYFQPIRRLYLGWEHGEVRVGGRVTYLLNAHVSVTTLSAWSVLAHLYFSNPWSWWCHHVQKRKLRLRGAEVTFPGSHSHVSDTQRLGCVLQRYFLRGESVLQPNRAQSSRMSWALIFTTSQWDGWKKEVWAWRGWNTAEERPKLTLSRPSLYYWASRAVKRNYPRVSHTKNPTATLDAKCLFSQGHWECLCQIYLGFILCVHSCHRRMKGHRRGINTFTFSECHQCTATVIYYFNWWYS